MRHGQESHIKPLGAGLLVVPLEHGSGDFRAARPLAAALPGMGLIKLQVVWIRLKFAL
jgi:hypothetical protein